MAARITPTVDLAPVGSALDGTPIEELIDRAADLKGELVSFVQSPRFAKQLRALLADAADRDGFLDETTTILTIDHFALRHRLADGRTLVERFVEWRRPRLSDDEREMMLGWRDVVEACYEVRRVDCEGDGSLELHNLLDDLVYRVYSNMGRRAFTQVRKGMFLVGRIVPVHPATDAWLVSGSFAALPKSDRRRVARAAAEQVVRDPATMRRNPALLRRAWEIQAGHRGEFISQVGSDLVVLPPPQAQETMREHYRRLVGKATATLPGIATKGVGTTNLTPEDMGRLPDEMLDADDVALVFDEVEGLTFYRDFGRLDALFADPTLANKRTHLAPLHEYLHDPSVSPLAIRRLVQRHPDGADAVFRALLRKPGFSWSRDGEKLLRRYKAPFFDREPTPHVSVIGKRLDELLRSA